MTATPSAPAATGWHVEVRRVAHAFGQGPRRVAALGPLDLSIGAGELVCLVGPSGCGKSTLLHLLAGFESPTEGTVTVDGRPVEGPSPDRGVVFQHPNLYPWLTVRGNVGFGLRMRRMPRARRREVVDGWLSLVGLDGFGDHRPYELSGGMQQRCQIARVLAAEPALVLMDEPFGALDALTRERLQLELLRIWSADGRTVLFVTHSVEEAVFLGTRTLVMSARPGQIVLDVPSPFGPDEPRDHSLRTDPRFAAHRELVAAAIDDTDPLQGDLPTPERTRPWP